MKTGHENMTRGVGRIGFTRIYGKNLAESGTGCKHFMAFALNFTAMAGDTPAFVLGQIILAHMPPSDRHDVCGVMRLKC
jgi:hypothetical protein